MKASPKDIFGHPDGITVPFSNTPTADPNYRPKLGNISSMLTGPAAKRDDPGGSEGSDPLDGQFERTTNPNLY